jgi:thiamine biosynthesis lipoprotein
MKKVTQNLYLISTCFLLLFSSACVKESPYKEIQGETMGSTYSVKYKGPKEGIKEGIDSILAEFNHLLSTYDSNSLLSKFNNNTLEEYEIKSMTERQGQWMTELFKTSVILYYRSQGAFNPALAPLLNFWGFGNNQAHPTSISPEVIDSLKALAAFETIYLRGVFPFKENPSMELNFNALAAGFATDIVAKYLEEKDIQDYLINITGELKAKGLNPAGKVWQISIEQPLENGANENPAMLTIPLEDKAMATSGNYRKFFEKEGKKYGHTLNPATGYPAVSDLLSATVISKYGGISDGLATAFMVMGFEAAKQMVSGDNSIEAVLIYNENDQLKTWVSWEN